MKVETAPFDVGIIVGRFQVHELHEGHRELIQHVLDNHDKVIIVLGTSPLWATTNNPLDYQARRQMIHELFPEVEFAYIKDVHDDELWSSNLDGIVTDLVNPGQSAVLYGSRDSFIKHYKGRFDTRTLEAERVFSGTAVRKQIKGAATRASSDFRAGVIHATGARYPTSYTTVDIAVLNENGQLLLGRKPGEKLYRFIGGFSDPRSESFEADAIRETSEEAGIEIGDVTYIGSTKVDDWRYRGEPDCIKTMLFKAKYMMGHPTPGDDIEEVRWFDLPTWPDGGKRLVPGLEAQIMPLHRPLLGMLLTDLAKGI